MKNWLKICSLAWIFASALACNEAPKEHVLRVHLANEPVTLDPARAEDGAAFKVLGSVMEGLMTYDGEGRLQHALARSVSVSEDGLAVEIELRPSAKWSDGSVVEAAQVAAGLNRSLDPASHSKLVQLLEPIAKVEVLSSKALRLKLKRRTPWIQHALTLPLAYPIKNPALEWDPLGPVTGQYQIVSWERDRRIRLKVNPYHPSFAKLPPHVEFTIIQDESTALSLFEKGSIDILARVPAFDFERLSQKGVVSVHRYPATYYLAFNTRKAPFKDKAVRCAASSAVKYEELARLLGSGETPAYAWIPPGMEGAVTEPAQSLHPKLHPKASGHPSLSLTKDPVVLGYDSGSRNQLVVEKVQSDTMAALGLKYTLQNQDWKAHIRALQTDAPQVYRFGWLAPFMDPITHLRVFASTSPNNYTGWKSEKYDKLVDKISSEPPGQSRQKLIAEAQRLLMQEDCVVLPLFHYVQAYAVSEDIKGFAVSPSGVFQFQEMAFSAN